MRSKTGRLSEHLEAKTSNLRSQSSRGMNGRLTCLAKDRVLKLVFGGVIWSIGDDGGELCISVRAFEAASDAHLTHENIRY
jgi:hypothetical protein